MIAAFILLIEAIITGWLAVDTENPFIGTLCMALICAALLAAWYAVAWIWGLCAFLVGAAAFCAFLHNLTYGD